MEKVATGAIEDVIEASTVGMKHELSYLAFVDRIDEHGKFDCVPVHHVVGRELKVPFDFGSVGVKRDDTLRVEVVPHAHIAVEVRGWIPNPPIEPVQLRVLTLDQ